MMDNHSLITVTVTIHLAYHTTPGHSLIFKTFYSVRLLVTLGPQVQIIRLKNIISSIFYAVDKAGCPLFFGLSRLQ